MCIEADYVPGGRGGGGGARQFMRTRATPSGAPGRDRVREHHTPAALQFE